LEKYLSQKFSKIIASLTITIIFFGTNIFYYTAIEPALSHQPAFFLVSFALWWSSIFKKNYLNFFLLGFLSGLLTITRIGDIVFMIPLMIYSGLSFKFVPAFFAGFLTGITPQLINQHLQDGKFWSNPYINGKNGSWNFDVYKIVEFLFFPKRGLFFWTPILFIGLVGLLKANFKSIYLTIFLSFVIFSSWSAYLSAGFGQRQVFSAIPFFAIGISFIFRNLKVKEVILYGIPFVVWNFFLTIMFFMLELGR